MGLKSIGESAFSGAKALKEITIPKSISYVGATVFDTDGMVVKVAIDANGKHIGEYSKGWCSIGVIVEEYIPTSEEANS